MTDPLQLRLEEWMERVGRVEPADARSLIRDLEIPARRRSTFRFPAVAKVAAAAVLLVALGLGLASRFAGTGGGATPPDPQAFAGDPRLQRCGLTDLDQARYVFELARAEDFRTAFPAALRSPELERPDPAFVVVFAEGAEPPFGGGAAGSSPSAAQSGSTVCVLVGSDPDEERNIYSDVDLAGFSPEAVRRLGPAPGETRPQSTLAATGTPAALLTPLHGLASTGAPIVSCGRHDPDPCERAIALVREEHPNDVAAAWAIVVDDVCDPAVLCDREYPFTSAVVLVPQPGASGPLPSYLVVGDDGPQRVLGSADPLPRHIVALVDALR